MAEEKEPTLEELMAELDAETTLDSQEEIKSHESEDDDEEESPLRAALEKVKNRHGSGKGLASLTPTSDSKAPLSPATNGVDAKKEQAKEVPAKKDEKQAQPAKASSKPVGSEASKATPNGTRSSTPAPAATPVAKPAAAAPAVTKPEDSKAQGGEQQTASGGGSEAGGGAGEDGSLLGRWWSSAKSTIHTAQELLEAESVSIDYQHGHEAGLTAATKVSAMFSAYTSDFLATASDVAASARSGNTKFLLKPNALFGAPLDVIARRECEDAEAEACPVLVEQMLDMLQHHIRAHGPLPLSLLTKVEKEGERARLNELRDAIDDGAEASSLELSGDTSLLVGLLRLFLLELPEPLLSFGLYSDFLDAALSEGPSACADVAEHLPPPARALARRLLPFFQSAFAGEDKEPANALPTVALAVGPLLLRRREAELHALLLDALQVRQATTVLLSNAHTVFKPSVWFLRPWLAVYALQVTGGAEEAAGEPRWLELTVDAHQVLLGGKEAVEGSVVDASNWGHAPLRNAQRVVTMVAAAKFEDKTLLVSFAGNSAQEGIAEAEEVQLEASPDGLSFSQKVTRRFAGRFLRPLPWQEEVERWAKSHVGKEFDETSHPAELQELWRLSYPDRDPPARRDPSWSRLGFVDPDPAEDFMADGVGLLALQEMVRLARADPDAFASTLQRSLSPPPAPGNNGQGGGGYLWALGAIRVVGLLLELLLLLPPSAEGGRRREGAGAGWGEERFPNKRGAACRRALGNLLRGEGGEEAFPLLFAAAMRWLDEGMEGQASSYIEDVFRRVRWSLRAALRSPAVKDIPSLRAALAGPLR